MPITIKSHEGLNGQNVCEIAGSMPGGIHQVILIADLIEEEYLEFAGMCG
ncbi:MAG: hypothetical protein GQ533_08170 [Methanosarcinaceae archaeon]|nr:hypothetical protein [Methanosarcinaceae archaeon]